MKISAGFDRIIDNNIAYIYSIIAVGLISLLYVGYFHDALLNSEYEHIGGFTRIVIPDTFVYGRIFFLDSPLSLMSEVDGVKNSLGPSVIWWAVDHNWFLVSILNVILLFFTAIYVRKLFVRFNCDRALSNRYLIILMLAPMSFYHSIGSLKEIPSLLLVTGLFYHFIAFNYIRFVIFAVLLYFVRYQFLYLIILVAVAGKLRIGLWPVVIGMVVVGALYPYFEFEALSRDATLEFRQIYGTQGSLGAAVEELREKYVISFVAVVIRTGQSIFEPLIGFVLNPTISEQGSWSIINIAYLISNILMLPIWIGFFRRYFFLVYSRWTNYGEISLLYSSLAVSLFVIGGFGFIHHRYLYGLYGLLVVCASLPVDRLALNAKQPTVPVPHV